MLGKKKPTLPNFPIVYPHGSCVKTEKGYFFIRDGKRYRLPSRRVVDSWAFPRIIYTSEAAVSRYRIVAKLGFRDGSLIYNLADGKMYLISENKRRHVTSPDALERIGATHKDAIIVSDDEIHLQELGSELK